MSAAIDTRAPRRGRRLLLVGLVELAALFSSACGQATATATSGTASGNSAATLVATAAPGSAATTGSQSSSGTVDKDMTQTSEGGHHRSGVLTFPATRADGQPLIAKDTRVFLLTIRSVAGVPERVFRWELSS